MEKRTLVLRNLLETHAHLDLPDFDADRESRITKMRFAQGIEYMINIGFNKEISAEVRWSSPRSIRTCFPQWGTHPHDATDFDAEIVKRLAP
ncbi:MAG: TatD family hydrolase [Marinilabiliales bacterium]|nr:TatD family hydrolase [Marinilabiliales bacterium]